MGLGARLGVRLHVWPRMWFWVRLRLRTGFALGRGLVWGHVRSGVGFWFGRGLVGRGVWSGTGFALGRRLVGRRVWSGMRSGLGRDFVGRQMGLRFCGSSVRLRMRLQMRRRVGRRTRLWRRTWDVLRCTKVRVATIAPASSSETLVCGWAYAQKPCSANVGGICQLLAHEIMSTMHSSQAADLVTARGMTAP